MTRVLDRERDVILILNRSAVAPRKKMLKKTSAKILVVSGALTLFASVGFLAAFIYNYQNQRVSSESEVLVSNQIAPVMYPGDLLQYDVNCEFLYGSKVTIDLSFPSTNENCRYVYVCLSHQDKPLFPVEAAKSGERYTLETFHCVRDYQNKTLSDQAEFALGVNKMSLSVYLSTSVDHNEIDISFSYAIRIRKA